MDNMEMSLNYDNPDLMSSDFFESVRSLENNLDDLFPINFDDDLHLSSDASCITDDVLSPQSFSSESERSSSTSETLDESASLINGLDNNDVLMSFWDPVHDIKIESQPAPPVKTQTKPTKIFIQNPNNKKIIAKPLIITQIKKNIKTNKTQFLKVQSTNSNGRPVLLPLTVKTEILNSSSDLQSLVNKRRKFNAAQVAEDEAKVTSTESQYPALELTQEEKRLLAKEGIQLPTHHPLTKNEERELKRIRRKIRNKISAQDSRKRKKEYVDGLEERVKRGSEENKNLLQRVKELQRQNKNLIAHVSRLQSLICKSSTSKATPSTCLMVVLLSALLISLPNMKLFEKQQMSTEQEQLAIRRNLLSSNQVTEEDGVNMEEFLIFKDDAESEIKPDEFDIENTTQLSKLLAEMGSKYSLNFEKNSSDKYNMFNKVMNAVMHFLDKDKKDYADEGGVFKEKYEFYEPDIDEDDTGEPLMKRSRLNINFEGNSAKVNAADKGVLLDAGFGIQNSKSK